jgi:hypothetical protein
MNRPTLLISLAVFGFLWLLVLPRFLSLLLLIPYEHDFWWMVPCAVIVMGLPCFVVSVLIEAPVNRVFFREDMPVMVDMAATVAVVTKALAIPVRPWPAIKRHSAVVNACW